MKRAKMSLTALAGISAMLALAVTAEAQNNPPPAPGQTAPLANRPTIAVFNMVAVMKEYKKAKYQVYLLTEKRKSMYADITPLKGEYLKLQQELQAPQIRADIKDANQKRWVELGRVIEDKTKDIDKKLNEEASIIIATLYDEIKTVVDKTAEMNGYHIVFAYPDAVGEEIKSPYMKELKLKPPAAQPFFVARQVDITGVVVTTLNTWYPSPDPPTPAPAAQPQHPQAPAQPPQAGPPPGRP